MSNIKNYNDEFISRNISKTISNIDNTIKVDVNFDILRKDFYISEKRAALYYINGMVREDLFERLQEFFLSIDNEKWPANCKEFDMKNLPYIEVDYSDEKEKIEYAFYSGVSILVVEGYDEALLIDARTYPVRAVSEPSKYRVLRGSRDGFVETLIQNTALIRRRIRSNDYRCEILEAGKSSRTDIAICYMDSRVDRKLLDDIKERIKNIDTDALTLSQESLAECILKGSYINPFPKFRYTERPDTTASSILEGQIALMVDTSPAAILLPTTIFDVIEEADDYYFPPITGTYLRFARFLITIVSLFLTPIFLLWYNNPVLVPDRLMFIIDVRDSYIPLFWQMILLELSIDGLKLAAVNTPTMLNTPLSLIAAVVIGEFAVESGWFLPQTMLYMSVAAIANFTHENYEFAYALKFCRIMMLILVYLFGVFGLVCGALITVSMIVFNKTLTNTSYIYPLYPLDVKKLWQRFIRVRK
ncbi:MAG: spore germination protein [Lachnospiraceae bacterium]|nr:spore germination protein [Lachnospiraceae bacterium]